MAEANNTGFDKSKHPMATIEGKGNRFVPKGGGGTANGKDIKEKTKAAMRKFSSDPTSDMRNGGFVSKADVVPARGFADKKRKNTKHHLRHARDMGFKNQDDYERAGVDFFDSNRGTLYYSPKQKRFYRYDNTTRELAISSNGVLHTYMYQSPNEIKQTIKRERLYEVQS